MQVQMANSRCMKMKTTITITKMGVYSTITFSWNNAKKELTIDDRKGEFPGMITERKFNIVLVTKDKGTGMETTENPDKVITYTGKKVTVKL